ncbi:hypothetical protein [Neobacillus sp.]|uniref:hypothetical protein n=1 Tax=Neobacillus sp. TaxID=2675273 RepID=UPI002899C10A|nr:hypothetical protein [Neobacillus sp.]
MIDWYVILFLAIVMLIFHMGEFAGHRNVADYLQIPGKNQVSTGTTSLLFRLLTGTFVFFPIYLTVSQGYMAGLVLSIAGTAVLLWFSGKIGRLNDGFAVYENLGAFLNARIPGTGSVPIYLILFVAGSEGLIITGVLAQSFMKAVFGIQPAWTLSLLFFFVFVFSGMGGAGGVQKIGRWLLFGFFTGITILPIVTILFHGVSSIHEGFIKLPAADWDTGNLVAAALLFMVFTAGHLLVYYVMTGDLLRVKRTRLKTTISLTAICWSSMPVALSVITVFLMSHGRERDLVGLFPLMKHAFSSPLLYVLVVSALSCFALSLGVSLHNLISLLLTIFKGDKAIQKGYAASLVLCVLACLVTLVLDIEAVFIFYIHLFISLCLPLWLLLGYPVRWGWELSIVIIASTVLGLWVSLTIGVLAGMSGNLGLSTIVLFYLFIRKIRTI